ALVLRRGKRLFDLFIDGLPAIDTFTLVADFLLCARYRFVVHVLVLVYVDLDALDARLGLRQNGLGFEIGNALLELLDAVQQQLRVGDVAACRRSRGFFAAGDDQRGERHGD